MDSSGRKYQTGGAVITFYYCSLPFLFANMTWFLAPRLLTLSVTKPLPWGPFILLVTDFCFPSGAELLFAPPRMTPGSQCSTRSWVGHSGHEGHSAWLRLLSQAPSQKTEHVSWRFFSNMLWWGSVLDWLKQYKIS